MRCFNFILVLFAVACISSCNVINPSEKVPTYVFIDSFKFIPTANTGTSSHKITSAWVYFKNQNIGVFDLPATVPILADGPGEVLVVPGITFSGLNNVQYPYPFYTSDTMSIPVGTGTVVNFHPETRYITDTLLSIQNEDFEMSNSFVPLLGDTIIRTNEAAKVFEGSYAGYLSTHMTDYSESIINEGFTVNGTEAFVEINYKSSIPFEVGLQSTDANGGLFATYLYGFRPQSEWTKVYVGLQEFISAYPNRTYRVLIKVIPPNATGGFVQLDNVKVISKK